MEAYRIEDDLLSVVKDMFNALKNRARFKPEELELARDPLVFSRFVIGPTRTEPSGKSERRARGLRGFSVARLPPARLRARSRNCQRFLQRRFVLGENNLLFNRWGAAHKARYAVHRISLTPAGDPAGRRRGGRGDAAALAELSAIATGRTPEADRGPRYAVGNRFVESFLTDKYFARQAARFAMWRKRGDIVDYAMKRVTDDLARFGLLKWRSSPARRPKPCGGCAPGRGSAINPSRLTVFQSKEVAVTCVGAIR